MEATLIIRGLVQGVFFRYESGKKARELGLTGWIRNEKDGTIKALVQGPKENLEQYIEWCRTGPPDARVEKVNVEFNAGPKETFGDYEIR